MFYKVLLELWLPSAKLLIETYEDSYMYLNVVRACSGCTVINLPDVPYLVGWLHCFPGNYSTRWDLADSARHQQSAVWLFANHSGRICCCQQIKERKQDFLGSTIINNWLATKNTKSIYWVYLRLKVALPLICFKELEIFQNTFNHSMTWKKGHI